MKMVSILTAFVILGLSGCSTPIISLGHNQTTRIVSGTWTFETSGNQNITVKADVLKRTGELGFKLDGVKKATYSGTGYWCDKVMDTTNQDVVIIGTHENASDDAINVSLSEHGGLTETLRGFRQPKVPTNKFKEK